MYVSWACDLPGAFADWISGLEGVRGPDPRVLLLPMQSWVCFHGMLIGMLLPHASCCLSRGDGASMRNSSLLLWIVPLAFGSDVCDLVEDFWW